jgi:hypothetical protein
VIQAAQIFDVDGQLSASPPLDCRTAGVPDCRVSPPLKFAHVVGIALDERQSGRTLFWPHVRQGKMMSKKPTATAVAGKFQSKDGSDLVQYLNSQGQVLWVDADGVLRINTTAAQGAVQQLGLPSEDSVEMESHSGFDQTQDGGSGRSDIVSA